MILAELKKLRQLDDDGNDITHELSRCHRYTLQLERQLRELLQSPQGSGKGKILIFTGGGGGVSGFAIGFLTIFITKTETSGPSCSKADLR